jgi:hypothetical protein
MSFQKYTDAENRFAIGVPSGWQAQTGGTFGNRLFLVVPWASDDFQPTVNVTTQALGVLTRDEYYTLTRLLLKQLAESPCLDVDGPSVEPPGGQIFEWTTRCPPFPLKGRQLVIAVRDHGYAVTATARPDQFERLRADFEEVLRSFQALEPTTAPR